MKEIEVKFKIADAQAAVDHLMQQGCQFGEELDQEDIIFLPNEVNDLPVGPGVTVLRVREQPGKILFTLKQGAYLVKTEKELEIKDGQTMTEIVKLLGFHQIAEVNKRRRACHYQDYEICIDEVENLGSFLEMEKITDENPEVVQQHMVEELKTLGVDFLEQVNVGYDVLMFEQARRSNPT